MEDSSGTWSLGTRLKCHVAAIGEKNRQVCPHPVGGVNRSRFSLAINSRRSANKIARCVAGLTHVPFHLHIQIIVNLKVVILLLFTLKTLRQDCKHFF